MRGIEAMSQQNSLLLRETLNKLSYSASNKAEVDAR
jgi:hypothetical protein